MIRLRSILFTPADNPKLIEKAANSNADGVCIDLEDSVPAGSKQAARELIEQGASALKQANKQVLIRINNTLQDIDLDINNLTNNCDILVLPKLHGPDQLKSIGDRLEGLAQAGQCDLQCIAMIEDARALQALRLRPDFTHSRVMGLTVGAEDLSNSLACEPDSDLIVHCFNELALVASSIGVQLLGFPATIGEYKDLEAYEQQVKTGRRAGARGAFAIHPNQLAVLNQVFSATEAEQKWAKAVVAAFEAARANDKAVAAYDGKMIDQPVYLRALAVLKNA
ncbi:MAG: citrate lyase subunit beta/citryl-CoA lyase [Parvicella sp.]|jgi:citrate lyase subunit beta/citryl-CoA lyase